MASIFASLNQAHAAALCQQALSQRQSKVDEVLESGSSAQPLHEATIADFRARITSYYEKTQKSPQDVADYHAAIYIAKGLDRMGSPTDISIFDTYLAIREATSNPFRSKKHYVNPNDLEGMPKTSLFNEAHWDLFNLSNYFFSSAGTKIYTKKADFEYLKHILSTAKKFGGRPDFRTVVQTANRNWDIKGLELNPDILQSFLTYESGRSRQELFNITVQKVRGWITDAKNLQERQLRYKSLSNSLHALRDSNSSLDIYIFNKYFDLVRKTNVPVANEKITSGVKFDNWQVFEARISEGSVTELSDFLIQNSHDIDVKSYLLKILEEIEARSLPTNSQGPDESEDNLFRRKFLEAKEAVDLRLPDIPAPESYQADLHIFSAASNRFVGSVGDFNNPIYNSSFTQVLVRWNSKLGRPQAYVSSSLPLANTSLPVKSNSKIKEYINRYFDNFRKDKTYTDEEIKNDENAELNSSLARTTYLVFTKPGTEELLSIVRIFDGSTLDFHEDRRHAFDAGDPRTFIEREFPDDVEFPERSQKLPVFEIGRLFASAGVEANSMKLIMARVADYFSGIRAKGVIYLDGNRAAMIYYKRNGATVAYSPEQLKNGKNATPLWVMRTTVEQIVKQFTQSTYEAIHLRKQKDP